MAAADEARTGANDDDGKGSGGSGSGSGGSSRAGSPGHEDEIFRLGSKGSKRRARLEKAALRMQRWVRQLPWLRVARRWEGATAIAMGYHAERKGVRARVAAKGYGYTELMEAAAKESLALFRFLEDSTEPEAARPGEWACAVCPRTNPLHDLHCSLCLSPRPAEAGTYADWALRPNRGHWAQDKWGTTALMRASEHGRLDVVAFLLDRGARINVRDHRDGYTALMWAAAGGHLDVVSLLLAHEGSSEDGGGGGGGSSSSGGGGGRGDGRSRGGGKGSSRSSAYALGGGGGGSGYALGGGGSSNDSTSTTTTTTTTTTSSGLSLAAAHKFVDKEARSHRHRDTALMVTARRCPAAAREGVALALLDHCEGQARATSAEVMDRAGVTALMMFAGLGEVEVVTAILERKGSYDVRFDPNQFKTTSDAQLVRSGLPFSMVQRSHLLRTEDSRIIELKKTKIEATVPKGFAGKFYQGRILGVGVAVDKDRADDLDGATALHHAAMNGRRRCAVLLLAANPMPGCLIRGIRNMPVDIDARRTRDGRSPLSLAAGNGHVKTVRMLLHRGALTELADDHGRTPLLWAAGQGHLDCCETLLDPRHCNYQKRRQRQQRHRFHRLKNGGGGGGGGGGGPGSKGWSQALLGAGGSAGALAEQAEEEQKMERHEHDKATEIIPAVVAQEVNKSEGDDDDDEDNGADGVQQPQQQPQQPPQPQHADMDHRDSKGYDAMLHAAVNRRLDVLEMFLERRPDLCESACNQGMTGMMIGARQGHHDVVEFLLESGADRDRVDALGNSALMWAGRYGHTHVVELIMKVPYIRKMFTDGGKQAHTWRDPKKLDYPGWVDANRKPVIENPIAMGYAQSRKLLPPVRDRPPPAILPYMAYIKPKHPAEGVQMIKQRWSQFGDWSSVDGPDPNESPLWKPKVIARLLEREAQHKLRAEAAAATTAAGGSSQGRASGGGGGGAAAAANKRRLGRPLPGYNTPVMSFVDLLGSVRERREAEEILRGKENASGIR